MDIGTEATTASVKIGNDEESTDATVITETLFEK